MRKTISELVDELGVTNIKIFMEMEKENGDLSKVKQLNRYRSDLKNAINQEFRQRQEVKTYE